VKPTFDATAIILAGGKSRRMGTDKSLLPYQGRPLIQHIADQLAPHFASLLVVTNTPERYGFLQAPMAADLEPDQGPLMGIASGLKCTQHTWNLVVATDIPMIPVPLLHQLFAHRSGQRCIIPKERGGQRQPLFGLYHRDMADEILTLLAEGQRSLMSLMDRCKPSEVPIEPGLLANLNTPDAYRAQRL